MHTLGGGPGGDDEGLGEDGLHLVAIVHGLDHGLGVEFEGSTAQVHARNRLRDDFRTAVHRLLPHLVHQFRATDASGETRVVLHLRRGRELAALLGFVFVFVCASSDTV